MSVETLEPGASVFAQPVVRMAEARRALRPQLAPVRRAISYPVLTSALTKAICLSKPRLGRVVEMELRATLALYEREGDEEMADAARLTLEWFRDVQAWAALTGER